MDIDISKPMEEKLLVNFHKFLKACEITGMGLGKDELEACLYLMKYYITKSEMEKTANKMEVGTEVIFIGPPELSLPTLNGRVGIIESEHFLGSEELGHQKHYGVRWHDSQDDFDDQFCMCSSSSLRVYQPHLPEHCSLHIAYKCLYEQ